MILHNKLKLKHSHVLRFQQASGASRGPFLSAWEMWLVNKAKEDRFKLEKQADEAKLRSHLYLCISAAVVTFVIYISRIVYIQPGIFFLPFIKYNALKIFFLLIAFCLT